MLLLFGGVLDCLNTIPHNLHFSFKEVLFSFFIHHNTNN